MVSNKLDLLLSDFAPRPMLTTTVTEITKPRFAVIDAHNHLGDAFIPLEEDDFRRRPVSELLETMDASGVQAMIDTGKTQRVALPQQVAVYLLYWTAFASGNGTMNFRSDPYGWDALLASKIEASSQKADNADKAPVAPKE